MPADNSDLSGKVALRRAALEAIGGPARVLDCFAGEGHMYEQAWKGAERYLGIDQRFGRPAGDPRGECWRGENRLLVGRAMDREPWNLIDLDAYGSPWQLFKRVARSSHADRLVVTLTCGLSRSLCGNPARWARELSGTVALSYAGLMVRWYDDVARWTIDYCLKGTRFVVKRARRTLSRRNKDTWYWLLELDRTLS